MPVITYRQALNDTLGEELARDPNVVLMGEEIGKFEGSYKITEGLLAEFGKKRVVDTPIAEEGFVGLATGAAMLGLRPVVEIMTINFILLAVKRRCRWSSARRAAAWASSPRPTRRASRTGSPTCRG